jgi:DeoR/GlpR family transcriptional regulator of sugar metabolism
MLAPERRALILDLVTRNKSVLVKDLCVLFEVTGETIRKDLAALELEGRLIKTYGGAYVPDGVRNEIDVSIRETVLTEAKDAIGRACAGLVREGDTVFLDESTTCLSVAKYLSVMEGVMVVTNSLKAAQVFAASRSGRLMLAGGRLNIRNQSFTGEEAREQLGRYYADLCFISCRGLDREAGLTDGGEDSGALRRLMLQHSRRRYLVADETKLNKVNFYRIGGFELIDGVVLDRLEDAGWRRFFKELGIPVTEALVKK